MSEIGMGSLYDMNKSIISQMKPMNEKQIKARIREYILSYSELQNNTYYMMLCRELNDYTIFGFVYSGVEAATDTFIQDMYECLTNRGEVLCIDKDNNSAIAIWMKIGEEIYCYYYFTYDSGVLTY